MGRIVNRLPYFNKRITQQRTKGQSLVEFALISVLLFTLLLGIMEMGRFLFIFSQVSAAAQEGVRYGATHPREVISTADDGTNTYPTGSYTQPSYGAHNGNPCNIVAVARSKVVLISPSLVQIGVGYDTGVYTNGRTLDVSFFGALSPGNPSFGGKTIPVNARVVVTATYPFHFMLGMFDRLIPNGINVRMISARTITQDDIDDGGNAVGQPCTYDAFHLPTATPTTPPTNTPTYTPTRTPTFTITPTPTKTPTLVPGATATNTPTNTPTLTPTNTATPVFSPTNTPTPNGFTSTPTPTPTITLTPTSTRTPTSTSTITPTPTATPCVVTITANTVAYMKHNGNNNVTARINVHIVTNGNSNLTGQGLTVTYVVNTPNGLTTTSGSLAGQSGSNWAVNSCLTGGTGPVSVTITASGAGIGCATASTTINFTNAGTGTESCP